MGATNEDPIIETRIGMARLEGKLDIVISSHESQLTNHALKLGEHDMRLNAKGKLLERHDERMDNIEEDIAELKSTDKSQAATTRANISLIMAAVLGLIAVYNFVVPSGLPV